MPGRLEQVALLPASRIELLLDRLILKCRKNPNGCIEWTGCTNWDNYGMIGFSISGKNNQMIAHRLAYFLLVGSYPNELQVLHECDNPLCVNPAHLWLGTHADNMEDKARKGRVKSVSRENNPHAKLTENDVREIRQSLSNGTRKIDLARRFGVSDACIHYIATEQTWKGI